MIALLLAALLATEPPAAPPAIAPIAPAPADPSQLPLAPSAPSANSRAAATPMSALSKFGLDRPSCDGSGCTLTEPSLLLGLGASNYGGFGVGYDIDLSYIEVRSDWQRSKGELELWGHFNGLGTTPAPSDRPPAGELGLAAELGVGLIQRQSVEGGFGPYVTLDAVSLRTGVFDTANLLSFTPNVEIGLLGHSAAYGTTFLAALHGGVNGFYGDGLLSHLATDGTLSHWALDGYGAAELRADLPLSPTTTLRLRATAAITPDTLAPGVARQIWWGKAEALIHFGPLVSGPTLTFFSPDRQLGPGNTIVGAPPETSFLWTLGL